MKLDEKKLQEIVEKIAYQQFGQEQIDDLYAKMGILNEYVQEQLALCNVSSSLLEITLKDWEHTCGDGCCYTFGKDIYLNGEKLDEQNAEDSENALIAVLNKLGYNVEINYC